MVRVLTTCLISCCLLPHQRFISHPCNYFSDLELHYKNYFIHIMTVFNIFHIEVYDNAFPPKNPMIIMTESAKTQCNGAHIEFYFGTLMRM